MKFVIETGSGQHTSSSAFCQVKFHGGEFDGQFLYQQKQFQVKANWDDSKNNERWVTTEYDLPEGTQIRVIGKGRTGDRGSTKWAFDRIYRLDSNEEPKERTVKVGLRDCAFKGRLKFLKDVLKAQEEKAKINTEEGF